MSGTAPVCRFGWECHRPDCWYSHPGGRAIDGGGSGPPTYPGPSHSLPPHLQSSGLPPSVLHSTLPFNPSLLPLQMQSMQPFLLSSSTSSPSPYLPPLPSSITKPITSSNLSSSTPSYSHPPPSYPSSSIPPSKRGPLPCRYGRDCHREECWFLHPEGRAIDEPGGGVGAGAGAGVGGGGGGGGSRGRRSSPGADEYDEALDEFEGKDGEALAPEDEEEAAFRQAMRERGGGEEEEDEEEFECPCCEGRPEGCEGTQACQAAGVCVCQADRIEDGGGEERREGRAAAGRGGSVLDDTWKDEWFPGSMRCACCEGYVFRCKGKLKECREGGRCSCGQVAGENGRITT